MDDLTFSQQRILEFFVRFYKRHRIAPTLREIAKEVGYANHTGAVSHVLRLIEKGYLLQIKVSKRRRLVLVPLLTNPLERLLTLVRSGASRELICDELEKIILAGACAVPAQGTDDRAAVPVDSAAEGSVAPQTADRSD